MNEFLRKFIMKTITEMITKNIAEWQVRQYALGWYTKQILTEEDLAVIEEKYAIKETVEEVQVVEENVEESEEN